jgi:hypothetical protein
MAMGPKHDHAEVPVLVGRRSTRLSVALPITVVGTDAAGQEFREKTFTLNVNKHGAEIATSRALAANTEITIENSTLGRSGRARVVQRRERRTPNSPYEVSLELLDPENIWGVRFPPADWEKDSPSKAANHSAAAEIQPAPVTPEPDKSEIRADSPAPLPTTTNGQERQAAATAAPANVKAEPSSATAKAEVQPIEETAVEMSAPKLAVTPEPEAAAQETSSPPQQPETASVPTSVSQPPASTPEVANLEEKTQAAREAEARLQAMINRLDETSARLEKLLSKLGDARGNLQSEIDRARADIQQAGQQSAQTAVEEFLGKLGGDWETTAARLLEDTQRRLQDDVSAAVTAFGKEAGAHLARLTQESGPELEAKQKQAVNLAKEQIAHAAEAAASEFSERLGQSAEEVSASLRSEIKASLEKSIADSTDLLAHSLREQAENLLTSEASPIPRLRQQMEEESARTGATFTEACAQEAERAAAAIKEEIVKAVTSVSNAAADANAGLWESSKAIKHDLTFKGEKVRSHLAEISSTSEEGFKNYTQVLVKGAQEEVQESFRTIAARSAQEFSDQIQKNAEAALESFGPQLQRQAEDAVDLCRGSLESAAREALAETQIHTTGLSRDALEAFSKEIRALTEQFQGNLRSSVQDRLAAGAQEMQSHLRKVGEEELRAARNRIQTEAKASGERAVAEIRERILQSKQEGERAIAETKQRTEAAAQQASDAVYKQVGVATVVLKDWGDQAAARLEAQFKESMAAFEKQAQELANRSLEASRLQVEATTDETRRRLEQASRILRGEPADAGQKDPSMDNSGSSSN